MCVGRPGLFKSPSSLAKIRAPWLCTIQISPPLLELDTCELQPKIKQNVRVCTHLRFPDKNIYTKTSTKCIGCPTENNKQAASRISGSLVVALYLLDWMLQFKVTTVRHVFLVYWLLFDEPG